MNYFLESAGTPVFGDAGLPVPVDPARYFREINEDSLNTRADWTWPLAFMPEDSKFKVGYFSSKTDRDFKEQYFGYQDSAGFDPEWPWSTDFFLRSGLWTSGAADCTARLYRTSSNGLRTYTLATQSFRVEA